MEFSHLRRQSKEPSIRKVGTQTSQSSQLRPAVRRVRRTARRTRKIPQWYLEVRLIKKPMVRTHNDWKNTLKKIELYHSLQCHSRRGNSIRRWNRQQNKVQHNSYTQPEDLTLERNRARDRRIGSMGKNISCVLTLLKLSCDIRRRRSCQLRSQRHLGFWPQSKKMDCLKS